jgi:hypothetical protein
VLGTTLGALIGHVAIRVNGRRLSVSPVPGGIGLQTEL